MTYSNLFGESYQMYHTYIHLYVWFVVCSLPIGGAEGLNGSQKTSTIYAFHHDDQRWKHLGDLPFECSMVDTLMLSGGGLMVVDGENQQALKIAAEGKSSCNEFVLIRVYFQVWLSSSPLLHTQ